MHGCVKGTKVYSDIKLPASSQPTLWLCMFTGILKLYEKILLKMDFIHVAQFLTKLPEDLCGEELFREVETVHMNIEKRKFAAVLASHKDSSRDNSL